MDNIFLVNEESGLGVRFQILDRITLKGKSYVVLMPETEEDREISSLMMEPAAACAEQAEEQGCDVCILEVAEEACGESLFQRVDDAVMDEVFFHFRCRNEGRFAFE